jgi:hypothetical protein
MQAGWSECLPFEFMIQHRITAPIRPLRIGVYRPAVIARKPAGRRLRAERKDEVRGTKALREGRGCLRKA